MSHGTRVSQRVEIGVAVENASRGCWTLTEQDDQAPAHVVDMLGAIALAVCNLAETVDARGGAIAAAADWRGD